MVVVVVVVVMMIIIIILVCANIQFLSLPVPRHETLHATEYRTEVYHKLAGHPEGALEGIQQ